MYKKTRGRLHADSRGIAAVEFAILSIPIFLLIMGGIEFGFLMFNKARLGGTLQQAARMATTGEESNGVDGAKIDAMVRADLKVTAGATVDIDKSYYDSFDQVGTPEVKDTPGTVAPYCWEDVNGNRRWDKDPRRDGLGGANDIISYKVTLRYPVLFPIVTKLITGSNEMQLSGRAALQNEPFGGGTDQQVKKCCISAAFGNPVTCTDI